MISPVLSAVRQRAPGKDRLALGAVAVVVVGSPYAARTVVVVDRLRKGGCGANENECGKNGVLQGIS
jgi:hypothetical protein